MPRSTPVARLLCAALFPIACLGQSLIVSVPSTEITHKKETMLAFEGQFNRFQSGNYFNSFTFGTYGIGKNTELAATLFGFSNPASNNRSLGLGFKSGATLKGGFAHRHEIRVTGGAMLPVSFDGKGAGYWLFGNISARAPKTRTRFTVGPSFGTRQIFGRRVYSTMVGVEQPLTRHWSVVSDWYSGTHDLAAGILALAYAPNRRTMVIFGWKAANNAASGKPALMIEITRTFGGAHTR